MIRDLGAVFRIYGFDGATLSLLTQSTGLERASLYHHFPKGKTDMARVVLMDALEKLQTSVVSTLTSSQPAKARIEAMIKAVSSFYSHGNDVCFVTIFSMGDSDSEISKATKIAVRSWAKLLEKTLTELGIPKPMEAAQNAISTIQGSLVLSKTLGDVKVFSNCLKGLRSQWLS